ncbi:MAG: helix-turn-helix domain-containing protein [Gammaproteobacteria bacterium]|nr:helix-turn-helix domain-containing protein [Gammaproteobacteria bacterium]
MQAGSAREILPVPAVTVATAEVPAGERLDYWRDVVSGCVLPLEFRLSADAPFDASLRSLRLGEISLSLVEATAHCAVRTAPLIRRAGADHVVVNFLLAGACEAEQDGHTVIAPSGSAVLCNGARPYALSFRENFRIAVLTAPRELLSRGVACPDRAAARDLGRMSALCPLARIYIERVLANPLQLPPETAARLGCNIADLVGMMIGEAVQQTPLPLSEHRAAARARVHAYVNAHLADPDLDPRTVARNLGLSPRQINRLLETEGISLGRLIWSNRLQRVATQLRDPALAGWSITRIALSWGFNDPTHFSRAFRRRFDCLPRDYRRTGHHPG